MIKLRNLDYPRHAAVDCEPNVPPVVGHPPDFVGIGFVGDAGVKRQKLRYLREGIGTDALSAFYGIQDAGGEFYPEPVALGGRGVAVGGLRDTVGLGDVGFYVVDGGAV